LSSKENLDKSEQNFNNNRDNKSLKDHHNNKSYIADRNDEINGRGTKNGQRKNQDWNKDSIHNEKRRGYNDSYYSFFLIKYYKIVK
jgi:hypothetical protein